MRLDQYLKEKFNIQSRNKATEIIKANQVLINKKIVAKPSHEVDTTNDLVELTVEKIYVSRAAFKLKYFFDELTDFDISKKTALDIGSSTGGFTQILLEKNISNVICVDVGSNQLHETLKNNPRIVFFENTDIRDFTTDLEFDIVTCDVSFISILYIIEAINRLASKDIIILFKPQFEVGTKVKRDKKGVVKDINAIKEAREKFLDYTKSLNWKLICNSKSKLQGKEGNEEEFFYFSK